MTRVALVGIGCSPPRPVSPELSYREMVYEAASRAYADAGVEAGGIDGFVTCAEDFLEGTSIFDEYTPDQLGGATKPVHTVTADFLCGLAAAAMVIQTGRQRVVAVEAHSKASNILTLPHILHYALDPVTARPVVPHPECVAGLEMRRWLHETGTPREHCAHVASRNKRRAMDHPHASYAGPFDVDAVLHSARRFDPLTALETAPRADGAYVAVLAEEKTARALAAKSGHAPVWILGTGWCSDSHSLETRDWVGLTPARKAAEAAFREAGIGMPKKALSLVEVDDQYAYRQLQTIEALGLFEPGTAGEATVSGRTDPDGDLPVNPSGGSLGYGHLFEAAGGQRTVDCVRQLRGEAGRLQVPGAKTALCHAWRGVPSTSHAVVIFSTRKEKA